jgi:hypothetical protein
VTATCSVPSGQNGNTGSVVCRKMWCFASSKEAIQVLSVVMHTACVQKCVCILHVRAFKMLHLSNQIYYEADMILSLLGNGSVNTFSWKLTRATI